jgi:hypothetical protein
MEQVLIASLWGRVYIGSVLVWLMFNVTECGGRGDR